MEAALINNHRNSNSGDGGRRKSVKIQSSKKLLRMVYGPPPIDADDDAEMKSIKHLVKMAKQRQVRTVSN